MWSSNAHLLTVVFYSLVLVGEAFRSFRFCQRERGKLLESILESTWNRTIDPRIRLAVATLRFKYMNGHDCVTFPIIVYTVERRFASSIVALLSFFV